MKVYFVYLRINQEKFDNKIRQLLTNPYDYQYSDGYYIGLYGWSKNKDKINEFINLRKKDLFIIKEKNIEKERFKEFSIDYKAFKIDKYEYKVIDEKKKIMSTFDEFVNCTENGDEFMFELFPRWLVDYNLFKDEYIDALDKLNYTTNYNMDCVNMLNPEDQDERYELTCYEAGFNLTVFGRTLREFNENEVMILFYLYKDLFI